LVNSDLTRLSRSVKDLFSIVEQIEGKGANIKSLKESWIDTTTAQGNLMFTIFAGISQFERDLISQRTIEGLNEAIERHDMFLQYVSEGKEEEFYIKYPLK
jgi:DNA invertase Pin-like site-specific DNA recombinase